MTVKKVNLFRKVNLSTIMIVAVVVSSLIYFLSLKEREKKTRLQLQNNLNAVTKEKITLEDELKKTNTEKIMLEETITKLETKIRVLAGDFDAQKNISSELAAKLKEKEKESEDLKTELSSLKKEKEMLESKIKEAQGKIKTLEASLSQLQIIKVELERKLDNIMNRRLEVELERVVIKPRSPGVARILAVNNSYKFVVINMGEQHGIKKGKIMAVYRGQELIAKIEVEKVYETMAVADIIFESSPEIIREEDNVREISSDVPLK